MPAKRYPLPKKFSAALSDKAYDNLRKLNQQYGYGNNYLLTILLEHIDLVIDENKFADILAEFEKVYGVPKGNMKKI